jgi:hypothetical protein
MAVLSKTPSMVFPFTSDDVFPKTPSMVFPFTIADVFRERDLLGPRTRPALYFAT